ncbi:hypothetical protein BV22DRAFT_691791 [Leucogyrophana mollusca]|uniref:Uncharacterized protein n=1 Tax=Leucogyrophana mollusca TaxID=85980 RepID=A0ACB8BAK9_9AGAM|nr:hypothetical protein BV22DRAFT_691791 [Leucogyrophana mollusca]
MDVWERGYVNRRGLIARLVSSKYWTTRLGESTRCPLVFLPMVKVKMEQVDVPIMFADAAETTVPHTPAEEDTGAVVARKRKTSVASGSGSSDALSALTPSPKRAKTTTAEPASDNASGNHTDDDSLEDFGTRDGAEQHPVYWYRDGDTVVRVEDTLYKLHSSRLIEHSTFFKELIGGGGRKEMYVDPDDSDADDPNWMPPVHIEDATASDFEALLAVDRRPTDFILTPPTFHTAAAILRAASALGFDSYYDIAEQRLNKLWSSRLEDVLQEPLSDAATTVSLARYYELPDVLKRALYELVRMDEGKLYAHGDGGLDELESADQRCVIKAREALSVAWMKNVTQLPSSRCPLEVSSCTFHRSPSWKRLVFESGVFLKYMHDPIVGLRVLIEQNWTGAGWCADCVKKMKQTWGAERGRIWGSLDRVWG